MNKKADYLGLLFSDKKDEYAIRCPNGAYLKQNTDSGLEPIIRDANAWQNAAIDGNFNYSACNYCNLFPDENGLVSAKPDCNGNCFRPKDIFNEYIARSKVEDVNVCSERFNCGSCNDGKVLSTDLYGWYFDNLNCMDKINESSCVLPNTSCTSCKCNNTSKVNIKDIDNTVNTILNGIDTYHCDGFCKAVKMDYNQDGDINILDILSMISCKKFAHCKSNHKCKKCKSGFGNILGRRYTSIHDLVYALEAFLGTVTLTDCQLKAIDFNLNGVVDLEDIYRLSRYLLKDYNVAQGTARERAMLIEINSLLSKYVTFDHSIPSVGMYTNVSSKIEIFVPMIYEHIDNESRLIYKVPIFENF